MARYDYDEENCRLVVRMPSAVHELFIDGLEDEIRSQLKAIRGGSDAKAQFAQKVRAARSTEIRFAANASSSQSKYEPDASFGHIDAQYPGVVIEVAYSQKKKRLGRLAENYLLDSDASVRVVVGLDIEYGKDSCKATLSIWRPELSDSPSGPELRAVDVVADKVRTIFVALTYTYCSNIPIRLSVTSKGTPSNTPGCDSASAILPAKNLYKRKWEMTIQKSASLGYSSANTLLRQRAKYSEHTASIHCRIR